MTVGVFKHIDPASCEKSDQPFVKPWVKVDGSGHNYSETSRTRTVNNIRGAEATFSTDEHGFAVHTAPAKERTFTDAAAVTDGYYAEVEALLRAKLPGVAKVVVFDHTIRHNAPGAARQPVQQLHVDQTAGAAAARVRRHLPADEAERLLAGRYQIMNVWRPIGHAAADFPLAVVDWRSTAPEDFVTVDLLYPVRGAGQGPDDRGHEKANPFGDGVKNHVVDGYEIRGETVSVAPNDQHAFYYLKDMSPDEVMFLKCFDSRAHGFDGGVHGRACATPHTGFIDPETPSDAKPRQSIEVRALVFYD